MCTQKVETDDAVGVDVRMHRNGALGCSDEGYFWGFCVRGGVSLWLEMREGEPEQLEEDHMTRGETSRR